MIMWFPPSSTVSTLQRSLHSFFLQMLNQNVELAGTNNARLPDASIVAHTAATNCWYVKKNLCTATSTAWKACNSSILSSSSPAPHVQPWYSLMSTSCTLGPPLGCTSTPITHGTCFLMSLVAFMACSRALAIGLEAVTSLPLLVYSLFSHSLFP